MAINIGIDTKKRQVVIDLLQSLLADEVALYFNARGAHWNVVGENFGALHKFFEEQYEALDIIMDDVAERIRALDGRANSTLAEFGKVKRLKEGVGNAKDARAMLEGLLAGHEFLIRELRKDIEKAEDSDDQGTADFLTGVMEQHEKTAWMVRAHLG